jgi:hypothetical protein
VDAIKYILSLVVCLARGSLGRALSKRLSSRRDERTSEFSRKLLSPTPKSHLPLNIPPFPPSHSHPLFGALSLSLSLSPFHSSYQKILPSAVIYDAKFKMTLSTAIRSTSGCIAVPGDCCWSFIEQERAGHSRVCPRSLSTPNLAHRKRL